MHRNSPLLERLVDSKQLCALVGLDVVPWRRVLLGPDNYVKSITECKGKEV